MSTDQRSVRLRRGVPADRAIATLQNLTSEGEKLRLAGLHPTVEIAVRNYVHWVEQAEHHLVPVFVGDDCQQRLLTNRYLTIRGLSDESPRPWPTIEAELHTQVRWMTELADHLERWHQPFDVENDERLVVADTSVFARGEWFANLPWLKLAGAKRARLVLPLVIIDELDKLSRRSHDAGDRCRKVIRWLRNNRQGAVPHDVTELKPRVGLQLFGDPLGHVRFENSDDEIISRTLDLQSFSGRDVTLVTRDYGMEVRAHLHNLTCHYLDEPVPERPLV